MRRSLRRPGRRDTAFGIGGLLAGAAIAALMATALWPAAANPPPKPAAAVLDPPLRDNEILLDQPAVHIGHLVLKPLRMACGWSEVVGSHAELFAQGQYCEVRADVTNVDSVDHDFNARTCTATATDGRTFPLSNDAQGAKRQPQLITVGSHDHFEFDIYFDVPRDATLNGFTVTDTESDPTVTIALPARTWRFE